MSQRHKTIYSQVLDEIHKEVEFSTSRSGGSGGQHVNKVETKVTIKWNVELSKAITEKQRTKIFKKLKNNINQENELILYSQDSRSQIKNKKNVLHKLDKLLVEAWKETAPRKKTRPSNASILQRKRDKKRRSEIKEMRKKPRL